MGGSRSRGWCTGCRPPPRPATTNGGVIFWTAFPHAFAAVMTTLALPIWLALGGIVLRGAGFAFRKEITRLPWRRAAGAAFAFSSLLTPFFMGTVVGAIATGAVPANASHASLAAWTSPAVTRC